MTSNHENDLEFEFPSLKNLYKMVFTNFIIIIIFLLFKYNLFGHRAAIRNLTFLYIF